MGKKIREKAIQFLLSVILVSLVLYSVFFFLKGDSSSVILGEDASATAMYDYTRNNPDSGFFSSYLISMMRFFTLNWGETVSGESIKDVVRTSLPVSLSLAFHALLLSFPFSLWLSMRAAGRRGFSSLLSSFLSALFLLLPSFLSSIILILIFSSGLHLFPVAGYTGPDGGFFTHLKSIMLPSLALSFVNTSFMLRLFREALDENMKKQFVTYARSKGVREKEIVVRAALKPSLPVIISATASGIVSFFASSTVVETVFALPGMGRALVRSAYSRDSSLSFVLVMIDVLIICAVLSVSQIMIVLTDRRGERENGKA